MGADLEDKEPILRSAINSIQRRVSKIHAELDDVSNALQHSLAQKESIQRLKINAEERLKQEKERKKQIESEISSATSNVRDQLEFTLDTISDQINEIRSEIRQRNSTGKKVDKVIEECTTKKSRLSTKIKKAVMKAHPAEPKRICVLAYDFAVASNPSSSRYSCM